MQKRKCNGFTLVELLASITILTILFLMFYSIFTSGIHKGECVEWEDVNMSDCYSYGHGTSCEHYVEKRCVRYEYND